MTSLDWYSYFISNDFCVFSPHFVCLYKPIVFHTFLLISVCAWALLSSQESRETDRRTDMPEVEQARREQAKLVEV